LEAAINGRNVVLNKLLSIEAISEEEYEEAKNQTIELSQTSLVELDAKGYALDFIKNFLVENFGSVRIHRQDILTVFHSHKAGFISYSPALSQNSAGLVNGIVISPYFKGNTSCGIWISFLVT